jgi:ribose 5-phosphate isomerase A
MTSIDDMKRTAGRAAVDELPMHGVLGLGTGSTVAFFLDALADLIRSGRRLVGVSTSEHTRQRAIALGIPLLSDEGPWPIALCIDGADEVDPSFDLIKGAGGALAREKIVNAAAAKNIIVVDEGKLSPRLGTRCPIPIEVLTFGHLATRVHLERYGAAVLRVRGEASVHTDAGNLIYDLTVGPIEDAAALDTQLRTIPGVVATGLFIARADLVLVGSSRGLIRLEAAAR